MRLIFEIDFWSFGGIVLGRLGSRLGSFWVVLGVVLGILGGLGAVLGAVDGQECRVSNFPPALESFLDRLGCPRRSQDDQKSIKK